MADDNHLPHAPGPTGGWGSVKGIAQTFGEVSPSPMVVRDLRRQNQTGGVMCVSCAWPKPSKAATFEICENGAKATMWELTADRAKGIETADRGWIDDPLALPVVAPTLGQPLARYARC